MRAEGSAHPPIRHLLLTGGTGFFGTALLREWVAGNLPALTGARLTLVTRDPARARAVMGRLLEAVGARVVAGDPLRPETLPEGEYTHILHAATDSTRGPALKPLSRFDQIVHGTRHILDLAVRCGRPRVLLTSSGAVYGPQPQEMPTIPEDYLGMPDPLDPHQAYGVGKRMAEQLAAIYGFEHGLETVIARAFAFVGPDLPGDVHFAIGNFIHDAVASREIVVRGDGTPLRTYLDQRDLAQWMVTLLVAGAPQRAYNVGSDEVISIAEVAGLVAKVEGRRTTVRILGEGVISAKTHRQRYVPDITRAQSEMWLRVRYDLATALAHSIEVLRGKQYR